MVFQGRPYEWRKTGSRDAILTKTLSQEVSSSKKSPGYRGESRGFSDTVGLPRLSQFHLYRKPGVNLLFSSAQFLIFFPLVFVLYWFVFQRSLALQNLFLPVSSYFFYGWWSYSFMLLLASAGS
jgi:hypothetical protein